ncbi:MAG TPA: hypothetical protein VN764_19195, partial [Polyangiaceae bacterium]|nr:hypothetical protein [Polyangiaceae bacterium]
METEAQFDALGRVTLSRLLNCQRPQECPTTTIEYDLAPTSSGAAYAERVTVGSTAITLTDFDGLDRPLQVDSTVDGVQAIATNIYDRDGQLTDSTDPEGMKISHLYDPHGFRIATLNRGTDDGAGILTSFQNDAMGHVVAESEFPLDADGVRSLAQDMSGPTTRYTYDVWYRVREVQAPPVGSADDLGTQVDPAGQPVIMTYDGQGHLLSQSNRRGHTQLWVRNALGWMESYQDGSGSELGRGGDCSATLCYSDFDNNGNPRQVIDGRGAASEYVYDAEERITSVSEAEGRSTSVSSYDGLGRPLSTNEYGVAHEYAYNENGALRSDSVPGANFSAVHQYDELGRPTQTSRSRGGATFTAVTSYEAGSSGPRVTTTIDAAVDQVLQLDKAQNLLSRRDRTGVTEHYERDAFYRTERVTRERGGQNAVVSTFKYYSGGMVRQSTDADLSEQTNYDYDARGRLIRTTLPTASNAPAAIEQHAYDADGNRVATAHPTGGPGDAPYIEVMTYNGENQLLSHSAAGETTSYKYDVMGNLVEERLPKSQAGGPVKAMEYDLAGRVTMIDDRGLVTRFPEYDQRGNLKRQEIPGSGGQAVATSFDYDELNLVTSRTERNVTGGSATTSFGNYDPNGNFRSLTDANGASITYQYDAIGRRTSASYPGGSPTSHITWD